MNEITSTIKIKRGLYEDYEKIDLKTGEPAFITDRGKLYIGDEVNGDVLINPDLGTAAFLDTGSTNGTIPVFGENDLLYNLHLHSPVLSGTSTAPTADLATEDNTVATTAFVAAKIAEELSEQNFGTAAYVNTGAAEGEIPLLCSGGKLSASVMPSISITDVYVVDSQEEMLALDAESGDIAKRTDLNRSFILTGVPTDIANWVVLDDGVVTSVANKTGDVLLEIADIDQLQTTLSNKAPLSSPIFTDIPQAPTADSTTDTNQIATTAFVHAAIGDVDTGVVSVAGKQGVVVLDVEDIEGLETALADKAPIDSPTFTGVPQSVTVDITDDSDTIATTAFVTNKFNDYTAPVTSVNTKTGAVVITAEDPAITAAYVLPDTASLVVATDSVQEAIAKLEKRFECIDGGTF